MFEPKKVMIVDDSKLIRLTVRRILEAQGIEVTEMDTVEPLLEEPWRADDLDLLILDINLPGTDGITALKYMQTCDELKRLPVMILSSYSERTMVCKAIEYGAIEYMTKPVVDDELISRVINAIGPLQDGVTECICNEVSRAKRGNTSLSIIRAGIGNAPSTSLMQEIRKQLKGVLRSIDTVLISRGRLFIIVLPVTGISGCKVVKKKINNILECRREIVANVMLSQVSFPDDGDTAESLIALLNEKGDAVIDNAC